MIFLLGRLFLGVAPGDFKNLKSGGIVMRLRALSKFTSVVVGDKVPREIFIADEKYGKRLIESKLAEEVVCDQNEHAPASLTNINHAGENQPGPTQPTPEETPGQSSQAAPALQAPTVKRSGRGGRKAKKEKSQ